MTAPADQPILGTAQYTGQEHFLGRAGSSRSGLLCLGVITGQMFSGRRPYGTQVAQALTPVARRRLRYDPVLDDDREIPAWIDGVLGEAVHPKSAQALRHFVRIHAGPAPP